MSEAQFEVVIKPCLVRFTCPKCGSLNCVTTDDVRWNDNMMFGDGGIVQCENCDEQVNLEYCTYKFEKDR